MSERKIDVQVDDHKACILIRTFIDGGPIAATKYDRLELSIEETIELADKFAEAKHIIQGGYEKITVKVSELQTGDLIPDLSSSTVQGILSGPGYLDILLYANDNFTGDWTLTISPNMHVTVLRKIS